MAAMTLAGSMSSSHSKSTLTTGTFLTGTASGGEMKMVLPLTWMVYWEAPMTVARMRAEGSRMGIPKLSTRRRISRPRIGPMSPKPLSA